MNPIHYDVEGQSEDQLQQKCVFWFWNQYPTLRGLLFHVPNGGKRSKIEGARFKKMGVHKGVADLILLINATCILIELKEEKDGSQSPSQREWQSQVESQNFAYVVIRSLSGFKTFVTAKIEEMV